MPDFKEMMYDHISGTNPDLTSDPLEYDHRLLNKAWDFITSLDDDLLDQLTDDQLDLYIDVIEYASDAPDQPDDPEGPEVPTETEAGYYESEEGDLDEKMPARRVRRDVVARRKRKREYRKVRAKKKIEGRRRRKTAAFKRYKKRAKRLGKRGLTSKGARKRTYINK